MGDDVPSKANRRESLVMSAILELVSNSPCVDKAQWINEANFGARYVDRYCNALNPGASVLEVGCGSGILLGILKESHPRLRFEGIEPFNDGFAELKPLTRLLQSHDTTPRDGLRTVHTGLSLRTHLFRQCV